MSRTPQRGAARVVNALLAAWVVVIALLVPGFTRAAPGASDVRQGTTRVEHPHESAPADAPRLDVRASKTPPAPDGFNTHDGGWIRFEYPAAVRQSVQPLISEADAVRDEIAARLGQPVLSRVIVRIGRTPAEMATLAPENAPVPRYASGVAYSELGLVLLTIKPINPGDALDLREVFRHELAHVALHEAVGGNAVPRWFNEGFAIQASGESSLVRLRTLWTATVADRLLPLADLDRSFPADFVSVDVAYAEAADVVRFLLREQDRARFARFVARMRSGQPFETALSDSYGTDITTLERQWRADVAKRYTFWPIFFSGSVVWTLTLGLFAFGWRRRRRRNKETLEKWAREEALEDAIRARAEERAEPRVHVVLTRAARPVVMRPPPQELDVPRVEHDGEWYTLH